MSTDLQDVIEQAIAEYMAANGGGMVTAWHFVADLIDSDGDQSWMYATAPDQRMVTTMGLIDWAHGVAQYEQQRYLDEMHGE